MEENGIVLALLEAAAKVEAAGRAAVRTLGLREALGSVLWRVDAIRRGARDEVAHWHWQNLNEKPWGLNGPPVEGRAWLHFPRTSGSSTAFSFEWHFRPTLEVRAKLSVDQGDGDVTLGLAVPGVAVWLGVETQELRRGRKAKDRDFGFSLDSVAFHWNLGNDPNTWRETDPRWQSGVLFVDDIFGERKVVEAPLRPPVQTVVPMPEGSYPVDVQIFRWEEHRARLPFPLRRGVVAKVVVLPNPDGSVGIPFPGKGENSWDIDDDAVSAMSIPDATSPSAAVAGVVASVLRTRERHGGVNWKPRPPAPPASPAPDGAPPTGEPPAAAEVKPAPAVVVPPLKVEISPGSKVAPDRVALVFERDIGRLVERHFKATEQTS